MITHSDANDFGRVQFPDFLRGVILNLYKKPYKNSKTFLKTEKDKTKSSFSGVRNKNRSTLFSQNICL